MRNKTIAILAAAFLSAATAPDPARAQAAGAFGAAPSAEVKAILAKIDAINRYSDSYSAYMRIASYSPDAPPAVSSYRLFSKGMRKALLVYLEPAKDAGKKIAQNGDSIWFYFPKAKQSMLIRPMNTLTGSIAVGDMIGEPVLELYDFAGYSEAADGMHLSFAAKGGASPYGRLEYVYRNGSIAAQKAYTRSGILLKIVTFVEYEAAGAYATKIKIQNAVYPEYYALVQITDLKKADSIPDFYFTPEGLADAGAPKG